MHRWLFITSVTFWLKSQFMSYDKHLLTYQVTLKHSMRFNLVSVPFSILSLNATVLLGLECTNLVIRSTVSSSVTE